MTDTLKDIPVFVASVEAGSFAQAAVRLHLSRSAVGKSIARLEERLGVRLFHRTTRSQRLTDNGALFYERCLRALEEIRGAESQLETGKHQVSGRLRVAMPVLFGRQCIAPLLIELAQEHPGLELEMSFSDRIVDLVEEGFDMAVRNGTLADSAVLVARRLGVHRMVLCAAPDYLIKNGQPQSVDDLRQYTAINYTRAGRVLPWQLMDYDGTSRTFIPRSSLNMDDLQAICDAALAGHGIAWLPCWMVIKEIHQGNLVPLFKQAPDVRFDVHAVWQQTPHLPLRVRIAIDMLVKRLPAVMSLEFPASIKKPR
ncbi:MULTISPECIES: LysR family transcriptional regulator [Enterobacter]|jgi:DNA-binding transcriptional LysR family regulator|uniref:LysR family transcriptional regulator n=5 Tax=Gammaproteobacteria TaxID=1236 RepID=A0AAE8CN60_9ENTR|nr:MULTISPECIES: LysR family transcriptional regulator [Enterobacter]ASA05381.1 LysR family transcriptional regulator [Enterobacter cloacae complex sp.]EIM35329.1 LysR family transcriptional regulator [Enterobacter cloacae subsp. cloacae GS1]ELX7458266.1 LysR family transcriptional regulator [Enterobacter hormaechei subsp. hoffmannii]MBU5667628.1 LysR family transcriptional regulator [Enterobacteriaceae bacterium S32_ASV_15]AJB79824.1 LysR family transcriptional regulator [Enterobacter hormaec